jgi:hypothetical protein
MEASTIDTPNTPKRPEKYLHLGHMWPCLFLNPPRPNETLFGIRNLPGKALCILYILAFLVPLKVKYDPDDIKCFLEQMEKKGLNNFRWKKSTLFLPATPLGGGAFAVLYCSGISAEMNKNMSMFKST